MYQQETRDEDAKKDRRLNQILLIAIGGVLILWVCITWIILKIYGNAEGPNELGDTFGAVNALFTSLAFAFLIYTALLQKRELEYQRRELKETKEEVAKSAEAQQKLVQLTSEQLELQRQIRASQVLPELYLSSMNWITKPGTGYVLKLGLGTKYNRVQLWKLEIKGKNYGFECINQEDVIRSFFDTRETMFPEFFRGEGKKFQPEGMEILVYYRDVDKNPYYQKIVFEAKNQFIGTPKKVNLLI